MSFQAHRHRIERKIEEGFTFSTEIQEERKRRFSKEATVLSEERRNAIRNSRRPTTVKSGGEASGLVLSANTT